MIMKIIVSLFILCNISCKNLNKDDNFISKIIKMLPDMEHSNELAAFNIKREFGGFQNLNGRIVVIA